MDNKPLMIEFDADTRTVCGQDYPWQTVEACETIAPMLERWEQQEATRERE